MKETVARMKKANLSERSICKTLSISRSHLKDEVSARAISDDALLVEIRDIHAASFGRYGAPRIHAQLKERGVCVSQKRVSRLMREAGIFALKRSKYVPTTDSFHDQPIAPNLLQRDFAPSAVNRVWSGDITYLRAGLSFCYLAVVIDLFSRRVVGWSLSRNLKTDGAMDALKTAVNERQPAKGLIVHHDRGSQYASASYRGVIARAGAELSMSRKGNCWDNAPSESFFATLKKELGSIFISFEAAEFATSRYIDWYNTTRRHSFNTGLSPIKKELVAHMKLVA